MIRGQQVTAQVEEVRDGGVDPGESLRLQHGLESPHPPFPHPGRLMRQRSAIVRVPALLEQHIDDLAILVDRPPRAPLLASDSNEDLINEECVAVAAVRAPQSKRVPGTELVAPQANRLVGDDDASLSQQVFDVPVA